MTVERIAGSITRVRVRRLALIWGWAVFLLLAGFVLQIGPSVSLQGPGRDQIVQQAALAVGAIATLVASRWEGPGGLLLAAGAILLGVLAVVEFPLLGALGVTALFLVPGLVLLALWSSRHGWYVTVGTFALVAVGLAAGGFGAVKIHTFYFGPAHPQSQIAAPPSSLITWVWSGALTSTSIRVNAQVAVAGDTARLAVADEPTFEAPLWSAPQEATEETNRIVAFAVGELVPDTDYFYAVEVDGELDRVRSGRFSTPPDEAFSFTVGLGACARTGSNGAVFDTIRELNPFLFLALGDTHYGNIETNDRGAFRSVLDSTLSEPAQSALYRSVPTAYVWDDHDFGGDDSDGSSASAPAAQASYREYAPSYELEDEDGAIYHAFTIGRVRFIVIDARSARDGDTMLGAAQLEWLKRELLEARDTHALTVWASSVPWIAEARDGADGWGGYAEERADLAEFIAANGIAERTVMVSGDAHMLAIDDGTNSDYSSSGGGGVPVLHAAALDRPGSITGGPYSEGAFPGGGQFATMSIEDDGGTEVRVSLRGYDWELNEIVSLDLTFEVG